MLLAAQDGIFQELEAVSLQPFSQTAVKHFLAPTAIPTAGTEPNSHDSLLLESLLPFLLALQLEIALHDFSTWL